MKITAFGTYLCVNFHLSHDGLLQMVIKDGLLPITVNGRIFMAEERNSVLSNMLLFKL